MCILKNIETKDILERINSCLSNIYEAILNDINT